MSNGAQLTTQARPGIPPAPAPIFDDIQHRYDRVVARGRRPGALLIRLPDGQSRLFGNGEPAATLHAKNAAGFRALRDFDELAIAECYMRGDIDLLGNAEELLKFRDVIGDPHLLRYLWSFYLKPAVFGQVPVDKEHIPSHYDADPRFFETWLDRKLRGYSHAFFEHDDESLEVAMERKFRYAIETCGLKPGDRVLDIGGGWGSMLEYGGERGLRVTSITISDVSARYMQEIVARKNLPCTVIKEHLLAFKSDEPFDAIVNLGVTEHLPDYKATIAQYRKLLKPGRRLYLDAYSGRRYGMSTFITKWIYQGNTSPLCLEEYFAELADSEFEVLHLQNDRHNYYLTCKKWVENLERAEDEIVRQWGIFQYRRFRLYLWCAAYAFRDGILDAHHMTLRLSNDQIGRGMRMGSRRLRRAI